MVRANAMGAMQGRCVRKLGILESGHGEARAEEQLRSGHESQVDGSAFTMTIDSSCFVGGHDSY